jgi:hypothetical protein
MLSGNKPARIVFTLAVLLNLFIAPWWLTFGWCLVGCLLFPGYIEGVACMALFDSVFVPGGVPTLTALAMLTMVLASAVFYNIFYYVDFSQN